VFTNTYKIMYNIYMKKFKLFIGLSLIIASFTAFSCDQVVLARIEGTVNDGVLDVWVDIGFNSFDYNSEGSDSSFKLMLTFDNASGETMIMKLAPSNSSGTDLASKFRTGLYSIDGSTNKFEGQIYTGSGFVEINSNLGQVNIEILNFTGGQITAVQGGLEVTPENGGKLTGDFSWQLPGQSE